MPPRIKRIKFSAASSAAWCRQNVAGRQKLLQALDEAQAIGAAFGSAPITIVRASTLRALGDGAHALAQARAAYDEIRTSMMNGIFGAGTMSVLAELLIDRAQLAEARALIEKAYSLLELGRGASATAGLVNVVFAEAELELARNNPSGANAAIDRFLASFHEPEARLPFPALYLKGLALRALGRIGEARAVLDRARREAEEAGSRMTLWQILSARSKLAENSDEAVLLQQQARSIIAEIAEHCPPDLRSSFLQLPGVQSVMRDA